MDDNSFRTMKRNHKSDVPLSAEEISGQGYDDAIIPRRNIVSH